MTLDHRVTPARPDLAAAHLRGRVEAARFAEAEPRVVGVAMAPLGFRPDGTATMETQLLFGEGFAVYEHDAQWSWGQALLDDYVGYVPSPCLEPPGPEPTHRVAVRASHLYPEPDFRARPAGGLSYGARVALAGAEAGFARLASGGWTPEAHLAPLAAPAPDWVAEAERFLGAPYLWGGRSGIGLDCSGLIQLALQGAGRGCPRDTDMQEQSLGHSLKPGAAPRRGDLMFWAGHVGVMVTETRLLHANIHHMAVVAEPLEEACARIAAKGGGAVSRHARLDPARLDAAVGRG